MAGRILDKAKRHRDERRKRILENAPLPFWLRGESDIDIAIVFETRDIEKLTKRFWGQPGNGEYAQIQVPCTTVHRFFDLKRRFFAKWGPLLKRPINVVVPRTEEACRDRWSSEWSTSMFW